MPAWRFLLLFEKMLSRHTIVIATLTLPGQTFTMKTMNRIARFVFVASTLCLLTACQGKEAARADEATRQATQAQERTQKEQKAREVAEKQRQEAEAQRAAAEKARQAAEESKSNWQTVAWAVGILAILLFMFGIALGSAARKDAAARKPPNE